MNRKIPSNLEECFDELKKILSAKELAEFKAQESRLHLIVKYHMGLGMWMRNNWGLWAESELAKYFHKLRVYRPDDMSGIILEAFWRHLNGIDIRPEEHVKRFYSRAEANGACNSK